MARRGTAASRCDHRLGAAAGHGVLARSHPSGHLLFPPSRHRRDHERELRRRVDRTNHRAVRLWHRARLDVARRPQGDAATRPRRCGRGRPAGFTLDGPRGPARVAQPVRVWLARTTGQSGVAVPPRGLLPLDRSGAGIARRFRSRSARSRWSVGAPLDIPADRDRRHLEDARVELEARLRELETTGAGTGRSFGSRGPCS